MRRVKRRYTSGENTTRKSGRKMCGGNNDSVAVATVGGFLHLCYSLNGRTIRKRERGYFILKVIVWKVEHNETGKECNERVQRTYRERRCGRASRRRHNVHKYYMRRTLAFSPAL